MKLSSILIFRTILLLAMACVSGCCCTLTNTVYVVDNVGRYYVGIEPTKKVYLTKDNAYVEFQKAMYNDHVSFGHECFHIPKFSIDNDCRKSLVYLKTDKDSVLATRVFQKLIREDTCLLERDTILHELRFPVDFPSAYQVGSCRSGIYGEDDLSKPPYPVILEDGRHTYWYLLAPLQPPAFVLDVGVTFAALPIGIVCMPFAYCYSLFSDTDSGQINSESKATKQN
jgi:hypothetical protein